MRCRDRAGHGIRDPAASRAHAAAPVCNDAEYTVESGRGLSIPSLCSDADGDTVTRRRSTSRTTACSGQALRAARRYFSSPGYVGEDSFTFKGLAGGEESNIATVSITVTPAPNIAAPQCFSPSAVTVYNDGGGKGISASCFDPDTQPGNLTVTVVDPPQHGEITGTLRVANNTAQYTPDAGFSGTDRLHVQGFRR